ncbi:hypothetical protein BTA51_09875 [Hahella sp. CCB-MM4]|uniref:hypothetical protein n=1 Tax=Hahella sp. (strain CCB-MM4) TaxID=1926491 RepID=UPI000B9BDAD4|nr:hypothetical protein [Hahella sp. CCB-MM4]OZG73333.1 hypothetical protein BTA51_09875 [Hahella sp. CCB-MM4]
MTLFSTYADVKNYQYIGFDVKQIMQCFGENRETRFDANRSPVSYKGVWTSPINIHFGSDKKGLLIPDVSEHLGRLYMNEKSYEVLKDIIGNCGEFLPVKHDYGTGYMFNTLCIAEDVDGVDLNSCKRDEYGDIEKVAFFEDRLRDFAVFRTRYDNHGVSYCQPIVKEAIEEAGLKGLLFFSDLRRSWEAWQE